MRQNSQLDLEVIGRKQSPAWVGDKGGANLPAQLGAHGNILQIRLGGTEPSGGRTGLAKPRVQPARARLDERRKSVHVCGFELGELTIFQNLSGQLMQ